MFDQLQSKLGATREMIYFALVDERYVAASDPRSNEHMIRTHLGLLEHPTTEFLSLYHDGLQVQDAAVKCQEKLLEDEELPFDVMTLGMGTDGHTASFFPGGDNLDAATDPATDVLFMPMTAPGAQETRITMTLPAIVSAKYLVLHIEGEEKRRVYEEALKDGPANDMPDPPRVAPSRRQTPCVLGTLKAQFRGSREPEILI